MEASGNCVSVGTHFIRGGLSLFGGALLAAALLLVLSLLRAVVGWEPTGWLLKNVIGKFSVLEEVVQWVQSHPAWIPLLFWALATFGIWLRAERATFFVEGRPDAAVLKPVSPSELGAMGLTWIEPASASGSTVEDNGPPPGWFAVRSWTDQGRAMQALQGWLNQGCGNGNLGWYPRKPCNSRNENWQPLTVALLTGVNGVGKSSLAAELARRISAPSYERPLIEISAANRRPASLLWLKVGAWLRDALPMLNRQPTDPWHAGVLRTGDPSKLEALRNWEPSRPTLLVLDEPADGAFEALQILEARRGKFWHPVRLLVIDQHFPMALDHLLAKPGKLQTPAVPLFRPGVLHLGDLRFDGGATRALWGGIHRAFDDELVGAPQNERSAWDYRRKKLWPSDAPEIVVMVSKGNPLEVALALQDLASTDIDIDDWVAQAAADTEPKPPAEMRLALASTRNFSALRLRSVEQRAADLAVGHENLLAAEAPSHKEELCRQLVLAACLGGVVVPASLLGELPAQVFEELYPGEKGGAARVPAGLRLPPIRPSSVGRAYVRKWLESRADESAAADTLARLAWEQAPGNAMRAALNRHAAHPLLQKALLAHGRKSGSRLRWAQGCAAALLYRDCDPPSLEEALCALNDVELSDFCSWLRQRTGNEKPQPVDAPAALRLLLLADGLQLQRIGTAPGSAGLATHRYWAQATGPRAHWALERQRALARAMGTFLQAWLPHSSANPTNPAIGHKWLGDVLPSRSDRLSASVALRALRAARRAVMATPQTTAEEQADAAVCELSNLSTQSLAASRTGGERAAAISQGLATQSRRIASSRPDFAAHAGIQEQHAKAWRSAAVAACRLGGERALQQARELAKVVQGIATAQPDFAAHAGIQEQHAVAWR
ncbi:MAG: hypothetical protein V4795_06980, partial [Pseudomonadota bacterium]